MREMLEEGIERLLGDLVTPELLDKSEGGEWAAGLWSTVEESGFTLALASEESGGAGATWSDVFTLIRAAGRHGAPIPFTESILSNWLLAKAGLDLVAGPATFAAESQLSTSGQTVSGRLMGAPFGRFAEHVVTVTEGPSPQVVLLSVADLTRTDGQNTAREPRDAFEAKDVAPLASAPLPSDLPADALLRGGALLRSAQIAGGLQRVLDLSLQYADERSQFGRQIGKFQAVQQQLAVLAEHTSLVLTAADAAFALADQGLPELPIASAKIVAGEAATLGAAIAHAVHGAIGVTYEHSLHFATRRLWSWSAEFGSDRYWSTRLGRAIAAEPASQFWPNLTAL